jgi:hypothetical protein
MTEMLFGSQSFLHIPEKLGNMWLKRGKLVFLRWSRCCWKKINMKEIIGTY